MQVAKSYFDQMKKICISQDSAITFYGCGGQAYKSPCIMSLEFDIPKVIKIGSFLTELFKI